MFQEILETLKSELSDLPDASETTRIVFRLILAALLGGVLGYDREVKGKAAGLRTHMLVAIGAAFFMIIPTQLEFNNDAIGRVLQGLVAGIGFLGAGAIVKSDDEDRIQGLTTAAGIWLTAAIGVAVGLGRDASAILATVLAMVILSIVPALLEKRQPSGRG